MNDTQISDLAKHIRQQVMEDVIPPRPVTENKWDLRAVRRAAALNVVTLARSHAGRHEEMYSQDDADVIMAIMELLDRVAGLT